MSCSEITSDCESIPAAQTNGAFDNLNITEVTEIFNRVKNHDTYSKCPPDPQADWYRYSRDRTSGRELEQSPSTTNSAAVAEYYRSFAF